MPASRPRVHTVRSLAQARLLADPFRLSILREFVEEPRTTMQVAERMGEKAPRLYRHVHALVDAGLLKPKGERQKRGTTERYLQAVASRFEVDASLFASAGPRARGDAKKRQMAKLIQTLFAGAQQELLAWASDPDSADEPPTVARIFVRGSRKEVERIRKRIMAIVTEVSSKRTATQSVTRGDSTLSGLVAFLVSRRP